MQFHLIFIFYFCFVDALEIGNSKKALQEADKLLKKNPQILCARALKSLAMVRMGKIDEAQLLINQICAENPCDDPTLQVMTFCYKELDQCTRLHLPKEKKYLAQCVCLRNNFIFLLLQWI